MEEVSHFKISLEITGFDRTLSSSIRGIYFLVKPNFDPMCLNILKYSIIDSENILLFFLGYSSLVEFEQDN